MKLGITCHSSFGGSGVIATELGLALAARGHEVHFVCAHAPPRLHDAPNLTLHEVQNLTHPLFPHGEFTLALASKLAEVSERHALQVLHVHYAIPLATSALLARELLGPKAPKLVTTVHGTDVLTLGQQPAFRPMVRQALQRSDAVTAPSRFLAEAAREGLSLGATQVEVISNFVDTTRFCPSPGSLQFGVASRAALPFAPVLSHNSNFRSLKRVQDVVRIFAKVRAQAPCSLVLIGDGPEREAVEALVRAEGLSESVRFLGEQLDVVGLLQDSDVFLMPSEVESFGLAALEAMSCGVPVVGSAIGGLPEVVSDGVTGFLHPVGDVEAMARSTLRLLQDEDLHRRQSEAARQWCLARWQTGPVVDAYEALYTRLLGTRT